ncbi:family 16 glycosylhydrolase [Nocardioides sp. W3-2-3]|uniref:family 16 glycosylhydrolase n=1 Tax=Nocardioides convexus TaxID=2712224 RepID=UPI0024184F35|nr:family 16 glycosylhydrolase [Nocardioides convexus]NHA01637.1 family 16 glycosylhydrolase [Nocardioides convexus]
MRPIRHAVILAAGLLAAALVVPLAPAGSAAPAGPDCGSRIAKPGGGSLVLHAGRLLLRHHPGQPVLGRHGPLRRRRPVRAQHPAHRVGLGRCPAADRAADRCEPDLPDPGGRYPRQLRRRLGQAPTTGSASSTAASRLGCGSPTSTARDCTRRSGCGPTPATGSDADWPYSGEIDIAETYSSAPDLAIPFLHYSDDEKGPVDGLNTAWDCYAPRGLWHTYTLEWTSSKVTILVDGKTCLVNTAGASRLPEALHHRLLAGPRRRIQPVRRLGPAARDDRGRLREGLALTSARTCDEPGASL